MQLLVWFVWLLPGMVNACEYTRQSGYFENYFTDSIAVTGVDLDPTSGNVATVTFDNAFKVFSSSSNNVLTISDHGRIFTHGTIPGALAYPGDTAYVTGGTIYSDYNLGFFGAYWLAEEGSTGYQFSYQHIKRAAAIDTGLSGTDNELCAIQRLETIIGDCRRDNYGTTTIEEMLIVTHYWHRNSKADELYAQSIIGVDNSGETYVVYVYEAPATSGVSDNVEHLTGFINGFYSTGTSYGKVCTGSDAVHTLSNCLCGNWNTGLYMFDVKDFAGSFVGSQTHECVEANTGDCDVHVAAGTDYWPYNKNPNCMLGVVPTDTCREDVQCSIETQSSSTATLTEYKVKLYFHNPQFTRVTFIDYDALPGSISVQSSAICKKTLQADGTATWTFPFASLGTTSFCGENWVTDAAGQTIKFAVLLYEEGNEDVIQVGYRVVKGTCNFYNLPKYVAQNFDAATFPTLSLDTPNARDVSMFLSLSRHYDDTSLSASDSVFAGQDLFLTLCYDAGTRAVQDNSEPYGVYGYSCAVAKESSFINTVDIVDSSGCPVVSGSANAFYIEDSFDRVTVTSSSQEWCVSTGKMDAAKWVDDSTDTIYFRCDVGFCVNQAIRDTDTSKCEDSCIGLNDSGSSTRRRRSTTNGTDAVSVQTSINIKRKKSCVEKGAGIAILTTELIILFITSGIAASLSYKVYNKNSVS